MTLQWGPLGNTRWCRSGCSFCAFGGAWVSKPKAASQQKVLQNNETLIPKNHSAAHYSAKPFREEQAKVDSLRNAEWQEVGMEGTKTRDGNHRIHGIHGTHRMKRNNGGRGLTQKMTAVAFITYCNSVYSVCSVVIHFRT
jgi:hypothetical protein